MQGYATIGLKAFRKRVRKIETARSLSYKSVSTTKLKFLLQKTYISSRYISYSPPQSLSFSLGISVFRNERDFQERLSGFQGKM